MMSEHPGGGSYVYQQPFTPQPTGWSHSPVASPGPLPAELSGDALRLNVPGVNTPLPMRVMTKAELVEHEHEHERQQIREHIAALHRSVDPAQRNAEHEAAVAEQVALYEAMLAAVGTGAS